MSRHAAEVGVTRALLVGPMRAARRLCSTHRDGSIYVGFAAVRCELRSGGPDL